MDNSFFVRRRQPMRDLHRVIKRFAHGEGPAAQPVPQCLALKQFRNNVGRTFARSDVEHGKNVGMIQSGGRERLLLEATHAVGVERKRLRQYLDGDIAPKPRVAGAIHFAHPSRAKERDNFIGT